MRAAYLASAGYGDADEMLATIKRKTTRWRTGASEDEVVFWFEHDLFDQLLLVRHLWWLTHERRRPRDARDAVFDGHAATSTSG